MKVRSSKNIPGRNLENVGVILKSVGENKIKKSSRSWKIKKSTSKNHPGLLITVMLLKISVALLTRIKVIFTHERFLRLTFYKRSRHPFKKINKTKLFERFLFHQDQGHLFKIDIGAHFLRSSDFLKITGDFFVDIEVTFKITVTIFKVLGNFLRSAHYSLKITLFIFPPALFWDFFAKPLKSSKSWCYF